MRAMPVVVVDPSIEGWAAAGSADTGLSFSSFLKL